MPRPSRYALVPAQDAACHCEPVTSRSALSRAYLLQECILSPRQLVIPLSYNLDGRTCLTSSATRTSTEGWNETVSSSSSDPEDSLKRGRTTRNDCAES